MSELEYWTRETCPDCGQDGRNLMAARANGLYCKVHFVQLIPDAFVERMKTECDVELPFFTDGSKAWATSSDYLSSQKPVDESETSTQTITPEDVETPSGD